MQVLGFQCNCELYVRSEKLCLNLSVSCALYLMINLLIGMRRSFFLDKVSLIRQKCCHKVEKFGQLLWPVKAVYAAERPAAKMQLLQNCSSLCNTAGQLLKLLLSSAQLDVSLKKCNDVSKQGVDMSWTFILIVRLSNKEKQSFLMVHSRPLFLYFRQFWIVLCAALLALQTLAGLNDPFGTC